MDPVAYQLIKTITDSTIIEYIDLGLQDGQCYYYRICVADPVGNEGPIIEASATPIDTHATMPITDLNAIPRPGGQVELTWKPPKESEKRSTSPTLAYNGDYPTKISIENLAEVVSVSDVSDPANPILLTDATDPNNPGAPLAAGTYNWTVGGVIFIGAASAPSSIKYDIEYYAFDLEVSGYKVSWKKSSDTTFAPSITVIEPT